MAETDPKLKKPSDASSLQRQPDQAVLFLDRGLGRSVVAGALRAAGAQVEIHDDYFAPDEQDEVWLGEVARRGWVVLAKDYRIRYRESARRAIRRAAARVFILKKSENLTGHEMAGIFVRALPAIYRKATSEPPPFIAKVGKDGKVEVWWPESPKRSRKK